MIGASMMTDTQLQAAIKQGGGAGVLRDKVVGVYDAAGFPRYVAAADGYPVTMDVDRRLLVGYGANPDRHEDWRTNALPLQDGQQPLIKQAPLASYPSGPVDRDKGGFLVTGQVGGDQAVHTATDIPLSAFGPGAIAFTGVMDNTDVFFRVGQATVGGVVDPFAVAKGEKGKKK